MNSKQSTKRWLRHVGKWWQHRNLRRLLLAVPALLGCVVLLAYGLFLAGWQQTYSISRYNEIGRQAFGGRDYETARIAYQRLAQLRSDHPREDLFTLALSLDGLGRKKEAMELFSMLAPLGMEGYPPAHLYLARTLLVQTNATLQIVRAAESHLLQVVDADPNDVEAHDLLSQIYVRMGLWDQAKKHLLKVVPTRSGANLLLAVVLGAQGDDAGSHTWAEQAAKYFRARMNEAKTDDPAARLGLANALVLLKDYPAAYTNLETGWKLSGNKTFLQPLAEVCAAWVRTLSKNSATDLAQRLKLIQQGLQYYPQNEQLLKELIDFSHLDGTEAESARATLNKLLAEGSPSPILHFCLGIDAMQRGATNTAQQEFAWAFEAAPRLPYVANNMAMILTVGEKPDYPRALEIIQAVVDKFPNDPNFRDTRGQILLRLGRYQEAVTDLELALPALSLLEGRVTHAALAEAYRQLGRNELAAEHERLAAGIAPAGGEKPGAAR